MANFLTSFCADGTSSDDTTNAALFGICDDQPATGVIPKRAYIDENTPSKWIATVKNTAGYQVTFRGVDYCIAVLRPDGSDDQRCDGMLLYDSTIIFVELKERKSSGWIGDGGQQLQVTINNFRLSHPNSTFTQLKAHLANSKKPVFQKGYQGYLNSFFQATGVVLRVEATIVL